MRVAGAESSTALPRPSVSEIIVVAACMVADAGACEHPPSSVARTTKSMMERLISSMWIPFLLT
jgi:hypothetical protein